MLDQILQSILKQNRSLNTYNQSTNRQPWMNAAGLDNGNVDESSNESPPVIAEPAFMKAMRSGAANNGINPIANPNETIAAVSAQNAAKEQPRYADIAFGNNASESAAAPIAELPIEQRAAREANEKLYGLQHEKVEDKNGRWKSAALNGLAGFLQRIGQNNGNVWDAVGGAAAQGIYGAVDPSLDEKLKHQQNVQKAETEADKANNVWERVLKQRQQQTQTAEISNRDERERTEISNQNNQKNISNTLGQLKTMGRYKRGENPQFDQQLDALGIVQPDFDGRAQKQPPRFTWNGQLMTYNDQGQVVPVQSADGQPLIDKTKVPTKDRFGRDVLPSNASQSDAQAEAATIAANDTNAQRDFETENNNRGVQSEIDSNQQLITEKGQRILELTNKINEIQKAIESNKGTYKPDSWTDEDLKNYQNVEKENQANLQAKLKELQQLKQEQANIQSKTTALKGKIQGKAPHKGLPRTGGQYSESYIRSMAQKAGRNPDEAVQEAKNRGILR